LSQKVALKFYTKAEKKKRNGCMCNW